MITLKEIKKHKFFLFTFLLFITVFSINLFYSLNTNHFSDDLSYLELRYIKTIQNQGITTTDKLTFNERKIYFMPIINYLWAFLGLFINLEILLKIVNSLAIASLILIIYFLAKEITKNKKISFISSIYASFIPYIIKNKFNTYNSTTIGIILILYLLYFFIKAKKDKKQIKIYIILLITSSLISPISVIFSMSLILYYLLSSIYEISITKYEKELILFSFISTIVILFFIIRDALIINGIQILWQNTPEILLSTLYPKLSLTYTTYLLGLSTLIIALKTIHEKIKNKKDINFFIIFCLTITTTILTWLKLIRYEIGLTIIAITLAIYTIYFFDNLEKYIKQTKFYKKRNLIIIFFIFIFTITNILPSIQLMNNKNTIIENSDEEAFSWIKNNVREETIILSNFQYSNMINYFTSKKTLTNTNFLGVENINEIFEDINSIKTTNTVTKLIGLLNQYNIKYFLINKKADTDIFNKRIFYDNCFDTVFLNNKIKIIEVKCQLE